MIKKSELKKELETSRSLIFDLQRKLDGLISKLASQEFYSRYSIYNARLKNLEDAIGQLIELKYPENMNEQQKIFFKDTLESMRNAHD